MLAFLLELFFFKRIFKAFYHIIVIIFYSCDAYIFYLFFFPNPICL